MQKLPPSESPFVSTPYPPPSTIHWFHPLPTSEHHSLVPLLTHLRAPFLGSTSEHRFLVSPPTHLRAPLHTFRAGGAGTAFPRVPAEKKPWLYTNKYSIYTLGFFSAGTRGNAVPAPPALNVCEGARRRVGGGTKKWSSEVGSGWNQGMMLGGG